jgi:hypothetical protein
MTKKVDSEQLAAALAPRSWEGVIVQLKKQTDGSYTAFFWRDKVWRPAGITMEKFLSFPQASDEELKRAGISIGERPNP